MMEWYSLFLFLHIMALVFWLGTDVGVFVLGKFAQNSAYGIEARLLLLKVAMILDMAPRIALVVSVFSGYQLAVSSGLLVASGLSTIGVWLFCSLWFGIVVGGLTLQNTSMGSKLKIAEKALLYFVLAVLIFVTVEFFLGGTIIQQFWLAVKVACFASIIIFMMLLEPAFMPAIIAFQRLETQGSSPEIETIIKASMDKTYLWVQAIYIAVVVSAILGVWKFMI
jgi:hypothetical protein